MARLFLKKHIFRKKDKLQTLITLDGTPVLLFLGQKILERRKDGSGQNRFDSNVQCYKTPKGPVIIGLRYLEPRETVICTKRLISSRLDAENS